jgi:hypothetical protein
MSLALIWNARANRGARSSFSKGKPMSFSLAAINWKTTALGVAALVSVAAHAFATGSLPSGADLATVLAAFGLIAAKDA